MAVTEHRFRVMASDAHVIVVDPCPGAGVDAERLLRRIEQRWSRFLPDSDVSRINAAHGAEVGVDPLTLTLIATMVESWRLTNGRYDPTVLPVLIAEGYACSIEDPSHVTRLPASSCLGGDLTAIGVDAGRRSVTAPAGLTLDPGGVGKGLAADLVVAELLAAGSAGALVAVGGDLACAGRGPHADGWSITVEDPLRPTDDLAMFMMDAGGVATSSTASRRWWRDGGWRHHVIDPTTAGPSETDLRAVTVVARAGWLAEAHATAALLAGRDGVLAYLAEHDLSGLAIASDGIVLATPDLATASAADPLVCP